MTGAVVLASGAYAIGTQTGGGSADARGGDSDARRFAFGPGEPFADLADELGVDGDALRDALKAFRSEHRSKREDAFAAALADALGKSPEDVQRALDSLRPSRLHRCAGPGPTGPALSGLARALDVTPAELRSALRKTWDERKGERAQDEKELAEFLADRLNLSVEKVEEALVDAFPPPPRRVFRGGPGPEFGPPGWHG